MKKRLKDMQFRDYTIRIDRVRERFSLGEGTTEYKDKMFLVEIQTVGGRKTMFNVPIKGNFGSALNKLFKAIREHA